MSRINFKRFLTVGDLIDALSKYDRDTIINSISDMTMTNIIGIQECREIKEGESNLLNVTLTTWSEKEMVATDSVPFGYIKPTGPFIHSEVSND